MGKTVLAAASLSLVAQGRLDLDTPLPGEPFTLRHLLLHRSGLRDYGALPDYHAAVAAGATPWSSAEMLHRVRSAGPAGAPGAGFLYSNVGYHLVRRLIERTLDAPLADAVQHLVCVPLGIEGVELAHTPSDLDGTAWGNAAQYHPGWVCHGLLVGPAAAAVLLLHRLLAGGLLPPDLLAAMRTAHSVGDPVPGRPWRDAGYGLGLMIGHGDSGQVFTGHTGGGPGRTAAVYQAHPACTAAAFAPYDDPAPAELRAQTLAGESE